LHKIYFPTFSAQNLWLLRIFLFYISDVCNILQTLSPVMQKPFNKPGTPSLAPRRNTALSAERETRFYSEHSALLILKVHKMSRTDIIRKIVSTSLLSFTRNRKKNKCISNQIKAKLTKSYYYLSG